MVCLFSFNTMITNTDNPRALSLRQQYVLAITESANWGSVGKFQEAFGWRPSGSLRIRLIHEEAVALSQEIIAIGLRVREWRAQIRKASDEEQLRLVRSIRRWEAYRQELILLRNKCSKG